MKVKRFLLLLSVTLTLGGCNKGCSYSDEIDSEEKEIEIGDAVLTIEAALIEHGNTRRSSKNYTVEITARGNDKLKRASTSIWHVDYEEDLNQHLDKASVRSSKDQFTHQLIYDNHICGTFHVLNGQIINSPYGHSYTEIQSDEELNSDNLDDFEALLQGAGDHNFNPTTDQVNIDDFPTKEQFLMEVITDPDVSVGFELNRDKKLVSSKLGSIKISHDALVSFFNRWPSDDLAYNYFTPTKIQELQKSNPSWYSYAQFHLINDFKYDEDSKSFNMVFNSLNDANLRRKVDSSFLAFKIRDQISWSDNSYIYARISSANPPSQEFIDKIESMYTDGVNSFGSGKNTSQAAFSASVEYFIRTKNREMIDLSIQKMTDDFSHISRDYQRERYVDDALDAAKDNKEHFDKADAAKVADHFFQNLATFDSYDQEDVLEFCDGLIDCSVYIPAVKEYNKREHGEDQLFYFKPESCRKKPA